MHYSIQNSRYDMYRTNKENASVSLTFDPETGELLSVEKLNQLV